MKLHVKLHMNLFLHMKVHIIVSLEALLNGARCSDDLDAEHYRLAHTVPMVGLWPTTESTTFSIVITTD